MPAQLQYSRPRVWEPGNEATIVHYRPWDYMCIL